MPVSRKIAWLAVFCLAAGPLAAQAPPSPAPATPPAAAPVQPLPPAVVFSENAGEATKPDWYEDPAALFGSNQTVQDLCDLRECYADNGLTARFELTQFYQGVVSGGLEQNSAYGWKFDKFVTLDGGKAGLWDGLFVDFHGEGRLGDSVNGSTGALAAVNTPMVFPTAGGNMAALTGVVITQALSEDFVVFAGKVNSLDTFKGVFSGERGITGFQNQAFVFSPLLARAIPYSTLAAGGAMLRDGEPVASFTIYDANNTPTQTGFESFFSRGAVVFGNVFVPVTILGRKGHQGVMGTWSSSKYSSLESSGHVYFPVPEATFTNRETGSWALVYRFDQYLYEDPCRPGCGWGVFGLFGFSDANPNPVAWIATVGVGGTSPLPGRSRDTFGVGYYFAGVSNMLINSLQPVTPIGDEEGVELFYNVEVAKWFRVTPDLQILNPTRQDAETAVVAGLRAQLVF